MCFVSPRARRGGTANRLRSGRLEPRLAWQSKMSCSGDERFLNFCDSFRHRPAKNERIANVVSERMIVTAKEVATFDRSSSTVGSAATHHPEQSWLSSYPVLHSATQ